MHKDWSNREHLETEREVNIINIMENTPEEGCRARSGKNMDRKRSQRFISFTAGNTGV